MYRGRQRVPCFFMPCSEMFTRQLQWYIPSLLFSVPSCYPSQLWRGSYTDYILTLLQSAKVLGPPPGAGGICPYQFYLRVSLIAIPLAGSRLRRSPNLLCMVEPDLGM